VLRAEMQIQLQKKCKFMHEQNEKKSYNIYQNEQNEKKKCYNIYQNSAPPSK
jgi:hypothetical protein